MARHVLHVRGNLDLADGDRVHGPSPKSAKGGAGRPEKERSSEVHAGLAGGTHSRRRQADARLDCLRSRPASRHQAVPGHVWDQTADRLPRAQQLAGTFPHTGSGPSCFGTVLAATGVNADDTQITPGAFETWLEKHTEPGIVFVWTDHGELAHATVTIGDGWMLTKPSQSWSSPRMIWTVREAVSSWRYPDTRLLRYRLTDGGNQL